MAALEKSLDQLREETREFAGRLSGQHDRLTDAFASERQTRAAEDQHLAARLEDFAVGGLHLEMIGVVWLLFGTLFSSVPSVVAGWTHLVW